jgi:putative membrane protein
MSSEHRLHPVSIFFHIVGRLREFLIPLIVLFVFGRSRSDDAWQFAGVAVVAVLTLAGSAAQYFSFRFRYDPGELVVRWGILFRKQRHIPYDRIQNIDAVQSVLQRMFGVATLTVQTGAGKEPEASFSVLPLSALAEMRSRVFAGRVAAPRPGSSASAAPSVPADESERVLLKLSARDLALAGVIENRGITLILAAIGVMSQIEFLGTWMRQKIMSWLPDITEDTFVNLPHRDGVSTGIVVAALAIFSLLLFFRVLSAIWMLLRLYQFTLTRQGEDLRVQYGLFTRVTATISVRRIQTLSVHEGILHRRLKRAALRVSTAGGGAGQSGTAQREWIAPIVRRETLSSLVQELYPGLTLESLEWRTPHPKAFRRAARRATLVPIFVSAALAVAIGWGALAVGVLLLAWALIEAHLRVRNLGWSLAPEGIGFRGGLWDRTLTLTRFARVQSVELVESPFDRRTGMAGVAVDTAGAAGGVGMPYMRREQAVEVCGLVAAQAARTSFQW